MDSGASASQVDLKENCIICFYPKQKFLLRSPIKSLCFANSVYQSLGPIIISLSTRKGIPEIFVKLKVVSAGILALMGLNLLDHCSLTAVTVSIIFVMKSTLASRNEKHVIVDKWSGPLVMAYEHVFEKIVCSDCIPFMAIQICKLHWQFLSPPADKLCKFLNRACTEKASRTAIKTLKDLTKHFDACQRI